MAFYELTLRQRYFNQLCINTFWYFASTIGAATPSSLELLAQAGFIPTGDPLDFPDETLAWTIAEQQNAGVEYLSAEAREIYSVTDFYEVAYPPPLIGHLTSGDANSPVVAYGLFTQRLRTDIRRGTKRFVGVSEGQVASGGDLTSGAVGGVTAIATKMSEVLTGLTADYYPCVLSFEKHVDPDTGKVTYRKYADPLVQEEHAAIGVTWTPYTQVRTQTSRQYGRGA